MSLSMVISTTASFNFVAPFTNFWRTKINVLQDRFRPAESLTTYLKTTYGRHLGEYHSPTVGLTNSPCSTKDSWRKTMPLITWFRIFPNSVGLDPSKEEFRFRYSERSPDVVKKGKKTFCVAFVYRNSLLFFLGCFVRSTKELVVKLWSLCVKSSVASLKLTNFLKVVPFCRFSWIIKLRGPFTPIPCKRTTFSWLNVLGNKNKQTN